MSLQLKLDEMYLRKARGAYVRSRAKWIEEGEKNTAYFCGLEKRRQEKNAINALMINNVECTDPKQMSIEVHRFYRDLYSSSYSTEKSDALFQSIKHHIPTISTDFKNLCDLELEMSELDTAIKKITLGKAPGQDGLSSNFYKFFWKEIKELLFYAMNECFTNKTLTPTMKQGLITLLPKPSKDKKYLENLRPIALLNVDYKLFAHIFANRLKDGMSQIISETQSGFLKGRSIHNNIRLVLDLLDYSDRIDDDGFILFLDFCKAFDTVEHPFILDTLQHFGFGECFKEIIRMLYNDINSSVLLPFGTCSRFEVKRGIRQGCPASPLLFIMSAEILAILLKNCEDVQHLNVMGHSFIVSQLADDTTLFLKNEAQIPKALEVISSFSESSGLHLNLKKCELMAIHDQSINQSIFICKALNHIYRHFKTLSQKEKPTEPSKASI